MKRKAMYMKPLMEVVHVEEEAPLAKYSTQGSGGAGGSVPGGGVEEAKGFTWEDMEGDNSDDDTSKTNFAWREFKKQ
ncbi:hypothetical protein [Prevotella sp. Rep29]|uniref:hypothetical protein n=1 Tax=Prevotella sp. Rep29 TaxID=2691580 RepID=UPI001C6E0D54|nr:hypothetical protein [Prevotella sp. Rep29]QYR11277.1 hypothetical protein GRF55_09395 [Prevotella sp. Rep29]